MLVGVRAYDRAVAMRHTTLSADDAVVVDLVVPPGGA
jgi:hypothetical protein